MLVMRRREGESILIGEDVELRILSISGSRVKIGITAPRAVTVRARELELVFEQNRSAALAPAGAASAILAALRGVAKEES